MEELIEAEAAELVGFYKRFPLEMLKLMWTIFQVSVIAKHYINKPTDVQFLFNINVLSSLWRIVAGKHLVIEKTIPAKIKERAQFKCKKVYLTKQAIIVKQGNRRSKFASSKNVQGSLILETNI